MKQAESVFRRFIVPEIGKMLMHTVEGLHCKPIIEKVAEVTPGTANAVQSHGRALFKRGQREDGTRTTSSVRSQAKVRLAWSGKRLR
jgi:hypothetical protein